MLYSLKDMPEFSIDQNSSYIALPLQNPKNLGSAIRSARAFGFNKIILFDASAHFAHPETIRASVGLSLSCSYSYFKDIDQLLENSSCNVYGLSGTGSNLSDHSIRKPALIIVGEEGRGLTPHPGIQTIRIEIEDDVESLNASTALSIFLYKYYTN